MIYVVNLNPSIDYHMSLDTFQRDFTNRSKKEAVIVGGKGINVSTVLHNYGMETVLTGFIAGFTGDYILESLQEQRLIQKKFIRVDGLTRINVKLKEEESESEINAQGPRIAHSDVLKIEAVLDQMEAQDVLVLSGSMLPGMAEDWYLKMIEKASKKGVNVFFDDASPRLKRALDKGVYLIKPNKDEFEVMMGKRYEKNQMMIEDASKLMQDYPESRMLLSLGNQGAYYFYQDHIMYSPAINKEPIHTVGAGDSMIAGYLYAYLKGQSEEECFRYAVASASASIFSDSLAKKEDLYQYLEEVKLEEVF